MRARDMVAMKDPTRKEHIGKVVRVIYSKPEEPYAILELEDGATVMGPISHEALDPSHLYRFLGRWEMDRERGPRFKASTYTLHSVQGRTGIVKYLCDLCDGVGPVKAAALYQQYGPESVNVLRDNPARVIQELNWNSELCDEASKKLKAERGLQETKIGLHNLFTSRGFSGKLIEECVKKWGAKAPQIIEKNPYQLLGMPSAGFKRCDKLWQDLRLPLDAIKRQVLTLSHIINSDRIGHTWFRAEDLAQRLLDAIPQANPRRAFQVGLRAGRLAKYRDESGTWITTQQRAMAELSIAQHIKRLNATASDWPVDDVPMTRVEGDKLPSLHQVEQLRLACSAAVGLFCGSPGTGKSHSVAYLLKAIVARHGYSSLAVCAPTGKAAVRIQQALREAGLEIQTRTVHGLLQIAKAGYGKGEDWEFEQNEDNPLPYRFVIVDETSMKDTALMASFLGAISSGSHVLFVGDPHQLPPVGHGAPLRDLIAAGLAYGELTQVRRNAGRIVHACLRIKNGEDFETSERIDLEAESPENLKLYHAASEGQATEVLESLLQRMTRFHPVKQTQVIVARNKARTAINDRLQAMLNPEGLQAKGNPFRVGDKIICLRNSWMHVVESVWPDDDLPTDPREYQTVLEIDDLTGAQQAKEQYVANGEIGFVVAVNSSLTIARFSESSELVKITIGKQYDPEGAEPDQDGDQGRGCNFDLAYACTCHKLQGSQAPCIIILADEQGGQIAGREWWYTAISRASKLCLLVGKKNTIDKQRIKQACVRRKTFLVERIQSVQG